MGCNFLISEFQFVMRQLYNFTVLMLFNEGCVTYSLVTDKPVALH